MRRIGPGSWVPGAAKNPNGRKTQCALLEQPAKAPAKVAFTIIGGPRRPIAAAKNQHGQMEHTALLAPLANDVQTATLGGTLNLGNIAATNQHGQMEHTALLAPLATDVQTATLGGGVKLGNIAATNPLRRQRLVPTTTNRAGLLAPFVVTAPLATRSAAVGSTVMSGTGSDSANALPRRKHGPGGSKVPRGIRTRRVHTPGLPISARTKGAG